MDDESPTQRCSTCLEAKTLNNFYKNQARPNGHGTICKECTVSKRKPTHRYCKKCEELKEIDEYKGCSVICNECKEFSWTLSNKTKKSRRVMCGKISSGIHSREYYGIAGWVM